ncbi:diacylglycerol kinase family enzyme [Prosthecobacter fusiformis]|uniref:Diacylglycerol kinase family enzyme n=1 Tax=Prosthecobacter fusiformis TaxID=48464 RepID=A0A4R7RP93_9BACT|nr:diacylglycerol kinase family protein [Prosthecobacter fusiformis]TDU66575.1 diacylglycerol kinase family enzyme [Prosthecobacter fusiformis]
MNPEPRRSLCIILNRESGTLSTLGPDVVEEGLREIFVELGCEVEISQVTGKEVQAALEKARDGTADAVIVGGGDGTVATAATVFARHDKPLGILPLGTFNLAARDVGMPLDWKEAARALVTAPVGAMDLLDVAGRLFMCVVVLGFYPALVMGRPEYHGSWIVKSGRTLWDALSSAATYPPLNLNLHSDGQLQRHRTRIALLANNDYEDIFGIIPRRRSLDAGYFTVYISKHQTRFGLVRSMVAWVLGRWKQDREIIAIQATDMEIDVRRSRRIPVMMDGEVEKLSVPFRVKLVPKALHVIAPRLAEETEAAA